MVVDAIDNNKKGLGRKDAKFYTGSINFSEEELLFIGNDFSKIKTYCIKVMKQYASQFNKGITIDDINWYAKIERNRYYKGNDIEVKQGLKSQGEVKPGLNTHIHFIVGHKSKNGKLKLSPKTNHKDTKSGPVRGGFNRNEFKIKGEEIFDSMHGYLRPLEETYIFNNTKINGSVDDRIETIKEFINEKVMIDSYLTQTPEQKKHSIKELSYARLVDNAPNLSNKLNAEMLFMFEQQTHYKGHAYKGLINLNRMLKKQPSVEFDLTEMVLNFAKYLAHRSSAALKKETIMLTETKSINLNAESISFLFPPKTQVSEKYNDESEELKKKQGRQKGKNNQGMSL